VIALEVLTVVLAGVLLVPSTVLLVEAVAARVTGTTVQAVSPAGSTVRLAIVVPAHNEGPQIEETVRHLLGQLQSGDRLVVVADNCDDATAELARTAGATVIERNQPDRRGKGFAIAFALVHLDADPPEVVVLVDADCRVNGSLRMLAERAKATGRPIQAEYLLGGQQQVTPMTAVSSLAILVRNRVRPRGLHRLGQPCHLTGSGMAFPWKVLRDAPATGANLVEDLVMGIEMALAGHPAQLCPEVQISSDLPTTKSAAASQRRRWEHGQLHTLVEYVPRLVLTGIKERRLSLVSLGLDLAVPPLALLTIMEGALLLATGALTLTGATGQFGVILAAIDVAALVAAVGLAWFKFGRRMIPLRYGLLIPLYMMRKIPVYLSLLVRGKQKTWERTARAPKIETTSEVRDPKSL